MQPPVVRRVVTTTGADFVDLGHCRGGHGDSGSDGGSVAFGSNQAKENAVIRICSLIDEKRRRFANIEDDDVEITVVVDVAKSRAPPGFQDSRVQANSVRHLLERTIPKIAKQLNRLGKTN